MARDSSPIPGSPSINRLDVVIAAAIQVLSNSGIQASMAGTGLRQVIGALEGPTASTAKILDTLKDAR